MQRGRVQMCHPHDKATMPSLQPCIKQSITAATRSALPTTTCSPRQPSINTLLSPCRQRARADLTERALQPDMFLAQPAQVAARGAHLAAGWRASRQVGQCLQHFILWQPVVLPCGLALNGCTLQHAGLVCTLLPARRHHASLPHIPFTAAPCPPPPAAPPGQAGTTRARGTSDWPPASWRQSAHLEQWAGMLMGHGQVGTRTAGLVTTPTHACSLQHST